MPPAPSIPEPTIRQFLRVDQFVVDAVAGAVPVLDDVPRLSLRAAAKRDSVGKPLGVIRVDAVPDLPLDLGLNEAVGAIIPVTTALHDVEYVGCRVTNGHPAIMTGVEDCLHWSPKKVKFAESKSVTLDVPKFPAIM